MQQVSFGNRQGTIGYFAAAWQNERLERPRSCPSCHPMLEGYRFAAHEILEQAVALAFDVPAMALRSRTRGKARVAMARQVAMYLAHVAYGQSLTEVGALFDRDRTTVAHACGVIEDRRDDPDFDRSMDELEAALHRFAAASIVLAPAMADMKKGECHAR